MVLLHEGNKWARPNRENHTVGRQRETPVVSWPGVGSGGGGRMESSSWLLGKDNRAGRGNKGRGRVGLTGIKWEQVSSRGWEAAGETEGGFWQELAGLARTQEGWGA